ncbi:UNVERIFIED_CONTAM: Serine/threonine-protein phosphatase 7 long form [Sesamum radiatum]|uniref:Serine/threonine-protein phosphatase 7 long form n=1 Tax=Sesamum radiatum TaxID=300843 RepID=A0AAW2THS7_SESRA
MHGSIDPACKANFACKVGLPRAHPLFKGCGHIEIDTHLITALVERWRPETHTFHFSVGEATKTLQDIAVIWALPVEGNTVSLLYLRHMENIDEGKYLKLGYSSVGISVPELCTASQRGKTNIGGAMQLLQIWAWSRIITLAPIPSNNVADLMPTIDDPENILPVPPYARRWSYHISQTHTAHNAIRIIRNTLDRMQENEYNLAENMTQQAENSDPNDFTALRDLRSRTIAYGHQFMNFSSERYPSVRNRPPGTNEPDPSNVYTPAGPSNVYTEAGPSNV